MAPLLEGGSYMAPQEMDFPPLERAQNEDFLRDYKVSSSGQLPNSGRGCHAGCTQNRPPAAHLEGGSYMAPGPPDPAQILFYIIFRQIKIST